MLEVLTSMPKKSDGSNAPRKEPAKKASGRITERYAIVTTPEYRAWMQSFMEHLNELEVSDVIREAIRRHAEANSFRPPPKR